MKKILIPKESSFFPSKRLREINSLIPIKYGPDFFETYNDWFYFIHIDPVQRLIHSIGMLIGYAMFLALSIDLINGFQIYHLLGFLIATFFYYGFGLFSHLIFDGGKAMSTPGHFIETLPVVHSFNFLTLIGKYDNSLRTFVKKYPFVVEAYDLIEIEEFELFNYLTNKKTIKVNYARNN